MQLGKHKPVHDPRTLDFTKYLAATPTALPVPRARFWSPKVSSWPMMANDRIGDCTTAMIGHTIQLWTAYHPPVIVPTDNQIIAAYSAVSGYNPVTGANDNGASILGVLNYWKTVGIGGHKVDAFAAIPNRDIPNVIKAIAYFGVCLMGVGLPNSARNQIGKIWTVTSQNQDQYSWGGHAVPLLDYDATTGLITCVTWGGLQRMNFSFFQKYSDEVYVPLSRSWFNNVGNAPNLFNWYDLLKDLNNIH